MRLLPLVALLLPLTVIACSSDEESATPAINQCKSRGFICWDNPPLRCIGQLEDVTDRSLKNACGKSVDGTSDVPCCQPIAETDTGTRDSETGDASTDAPLGDATDGG